MLLGQLSSHIFVYNMGKVASMAIYNGLVKQGRTVHHFHNLDPDYLSYVANRVDIINYSVERMHKNILRRKLVDEGYNSFVRLLVPFRDPVARLVSLVHFSVHYKPKFGSIEKGQKTDEKILQVIRMIEARVMENVGFSLDELYQRIKALRLKHGDTEIPEINQLRWVIDARLSTEWFELELERFGGLNVLAGPRFPDSAATYPYQNALLIKTEKLSDSAAVNDIRRFCQLEVLDITHANTGEEHGATEIYDKVRSTTFSKAFLDIFYRSSIVQHLYSSEEIQTFYHRWSD